jgi:hypothetical protein
VGLTIDWKLLTSNETVSHQFAGSLFADCPCDSCQAWVYRTGVKPLALWRDGRFGSVLFFAAPTVGLFPFEFPSLHHEDAELMPIIKRWRSTGGGAVGIHTELDTPRGLQQLGGGANRRLRLTLGRAGTEVAMIRLTNAQRVWTCRVGIDGFVLLGTPLPDPVTTAVAIRSDGSVIPGSELVL